MSIFSTPEVKEINPEIDMDLSEASFEHALTLLDFYTGQYIGADATRIGITTSRVDFFEACRIASVYFGWVENVCCGVFIDKDYTDGEWTVIDGMTRFRSKGA